MSCCSCLPSGCHLTEYLVHYFLLVEMTLFRPYNLVGLMALSREENHVSRFGGHYSRAYRLLTILYEKRFAASAEVEAGLDFRDDVGGLLRAAVVRGDIKPVGIFLCHGCHLRTFCPVSVSSAAEQANEPASAVDVLESLEHILKRVRSVCVVYDDSDILRSVEGFEPSGSRLQSAECHKCLLRLRSEYNRRGVDCQKIVGVVLSDEWSPALGPVDFQQHALEALLKYAAAVVGELVMKKLKDVDEVAYVRFASVYRQFKDINTFMDELKKVLK